MKLSTNKHSYLIQHAALLNNVAASTYVIRKQRKRIKKKLPSSRKGCPTRFRRRRSVMDIFNELGRKMFRRAYRMHIEAFWELYKKIKPHLWAACGYTPKPVRERYVPNGRIHPTVRLAVAIRMFAGAEAVDMGCTYGISRTESHDSLDYVIDSINKEKKLKIEFPTSHDEQRKIASGFKNKSTAGIDCCCGCIDGMLIWMNKPTETECKNAGVGSQKFYCGRKHKFGLNLQAICDSKKRFLYLSIIFPAATSDFLAFEASPFLQKLEQQGFLAEGLCLFGDNAYVNRYYMATPYPNVAQNSQKDNYNFYHSQIRINIECAFGILVSRFGIIRKPLPTGFTMKKIAALMNCLCCIHNFVIDTKFEPEVPALITEEDHFQMVLDGAISMETEQYVNERNGGDGIVEIPRQILDGGEHFDDDPGYILRRRTVTRRITVGESNSDVLPRENICCHVSELDLRRPIPRSY
jgi:hypothetical protein